MLNIPRENVKAFISIVGGLVLLIIISLIIDVNFIHKSVFHEAEPDLTQYSNTAESKVEENKYNLVTEERRVLYYTDEIMDMINAKDFGKLYNILDENYKKYYVSSVERLKEDMSRFADGEYSLTYDEYFKEGNMFLIDARFEKINKTREDIINGVGYPIDTLVIKEIEKGKYTVAFGGFINKEALEKEDSNDLIRVKVKELTVKSDYTEVVLYVENLTDESITLYDDRMDIYVKHGANYRYINPNTISKELKPKAIAVFRTTFKNIYEKDSSPTALRFIGVHGVDGKEKGIEINF